jgi:hypothetical protein
MLLAAGFRMMSKAAQNSDHVASVTCKAILEEKAVRERHDRDQGSQNTLTHRSS